MTDAELQEALRLAEEALTDERRLQTYRGVVREKFLARAVKELVAKVERLKKELEEARAVVEAARRWRSGEARGWGASTMLGIDMLKQAVDEHDRKVKP